MGTVRLTLRTDKPSKEGSFPIELCYQLHGKRKYFYTKERLYAGNWMDKDQIAIYLDKKSAKKLLPAVDYNLFPTSKDIENVNSSLTVIRKEISDIEKRYELNGIPYSVEMVVTSLKATKSDTTKTDAPSNQVFDFIERYIQDNAASRESGSLAVYKTLKNHLQKFQSDKKDRVTFENIDLAFFQRFQNYLINVRTKGAPNGLGNATIAKQLSTLKTFLGYAKMHGIDVSNRYKDFKIKRESLEVIALTNEEFETLYNYDLSNNHRLDQVRDVFCFSCATGLRYSDLAQLKREHVKKDEIRLNVTKTKQHLVIPLNPFSHSILQKYSEMMKPLPMISNQKMNDYIKELCKKAEIVESVQIVRFRGNRREEISYPKYDLISCHTGRKTFCTLSLEKGMSAEEVMQISGHKTYSSFSRYVKITEQRTKVVMGKAWGEVPRGNLKAV